MISNENHVRRCIVQRLSLVFHSRDKNYMPTNSIVNLHAKNHKKPRFKFFKIRKMVTNIITFLGVEDDFDTETKNDK